MNNVGTITLTLKDLLGLIGDLDDNPGLNTPRERFRSMISQNAHSAGQLRDWIGECVRNSGPQFNRALQDLVNYAGKLLGFTVEFGRYQGVQGENGFDGLWTSPTGFHVVVEVKTTEIYAIKTNILVGYVDQLISNRKIENWNSALGLYIVGRPDPEIRQVEHSITIERRTDQLRVITADALLTLAELMTEYDVTHEDVLSILRPSGPKVDPIVVIMERLAAERGQTASVEPEQSASEPIQKVIPQPQLQGNQFDRKEDRYRHVLASTANQPSYWIVSVAPNEAEKVEDVVARLIGREHVFACAEGSPLRQIRPDDWICFYAKGIQGIIAHAKVVAAPSRQFHPAIRDNKKYCWAFSLAEPAVYVHQPLVLSAELRSKLHAFSGKDPNGIWAWFVQQPHRISHADFIAMTNRGRS